MAEAKKAEIFKLLEPAIRSLGLELWGIELALSRSRGLLRVYIDHPERGIQLADCEASSREISALMDVHDPISSQYTLEVSSPGLDRPLYDPAHYQRYVGHEIRFTAHAPVAGRRRFVGRLEAADGEGFVLSVDGQAIRFAYADVEKARLVPSLT